MTLQTMGVELEAVQTALSLEQALAMLGLDVRRAVEEDERQAVRALSDEEDEAERPRSARDDGRGRRRAPRRRGEATVRAAARPKRKLRFADT